METVQKKIGVLTSGGDAPGMNAAIRAVVRTAAHEGINVVGIKKGYNGLIHGDFFEMNARTVSDIIQRGGTMLHTARSPGMLTKEGRKSAVNIYNALKLDALVVIGGDGSFRGARDLSQLGVNAICIPGTIDLDIKCTDYSIGFDTAVNTAMDAINKIRDTSSAHERCSVVEVMGRNAGYLALWCAVTGGSEDVIIPEMHEAGNIDALKQKIVETVLYNRAKGKNLNIIVVAEGIGESGKIAKHIQDVTGLDARSTILGHLQRGGSPTALDRMHATMMGNRAVKLILEDKKNRVVAFKGGNYVDYDIEEALKMEKVIDLQLYEIARIMST